MGVSINFGNIQKLFAASQAFSKKIENTTERIQSNINKISNPDFANGMVGGQGDAAVKALAKGREALEELLEAIRKTRHFIDAKLGQAHKLTQDVNGFEAQGAKLAQNKDNMNLKRK